LFGRELKGERFIELWAAASQSFMSDILTIVADEQVGTVAGVTGQMANGDAIELELLLLPLAATRPNLARTIGVLVPLKMPDWASTRSAHLQSGLSGTSVFRPKSAGCRGSCDLCNGA
jgi:hypothetical protein